MLCKYIFWWILKSNVLFLIIIKSLIIQIIRTFISFHCCKSQISKSHIIPSKSIWTDQCCCMWHACLCVGVCTVISMTSSKLTCALFTHIWIATKWIVRVPIYQFILNELSGQHDTLLAETRTIHSHIITSLQNCSVKLFKKGNCLFFVIDFIRC